MSTLIAFDFGLDPGEDHRINRLRTGKAAEQSAGQRRDEKQRRCRQNQHKGQ